MHPSSRGIVFDKVRKAMKARGVKYKDLAAALEVSEPTIKRLFQDKDCKLSRLIEICHFLKLSIDDILSTEMRPEPRAEFLPAAVERQLAENDSLFAVLILLMDRYSLEEIARQYGVSEASIFRYARDLERLNLVEILENNHVRLLMHLPLKWLPNGPLIEQIKKTNQAYLGWVMSRTDQDDACFLSLARQMLPETAQVLQKELQQLHEKFIELARQDRLLHAEHELTSHKWTAAMSRVNFGEILKVEEYRR
ncbi:helix-turn-helix domain-containing protein [Terasakiella sp. A23]|uniref:helix-turn-helix domain-containing protein n=1 Tax=Terasakiella sp. FCG-A23 TaxID=3080561 RepID=UPI0029559F77|nr:helix-turn-helix domain-containing protein [Terasakiella sp. A23]MDV7339062.1 helix-turn-helix domain-containing protein [Terasakiella sp. A23]